MGDDAAGYEDRSGLAAQFARQSRACRENGSPLYAEICRAASLHLAAGGALAEVLAPWADARDGDLIPLRVLGAAHRAVLERRAPALALWFPSVGGTAPVDAAGRTACFAAWVDVVTGDGDRLPALLASPPQTNDPGRAASLAGVLAHVSAAYGLPLRVHELGASAGLNLLADRARITWLGGETGPQGSPLVLEDAWEGEPLPPAAAIEVVERVAVDLAPVDVTTTEGRLHLTSYVWPDQTERFERLRASYELAGQVPVELVRSDLVDHLETLVPQAGTALVVFHSVTWIYLDAAARARAEVAFQSLASAATHEAPVVHVAREHLGDLLGMSFAVITRWWPAPPSGPLAGLAAGAPTLLADTPPHGLPVVWQPPAEATLAAL
jgi:hypothetical protein